MSKNGQSKAIENRVWLRASRQEQERLLDVWEHEGELAYRRMVLKLGRQYG